MHGHCDLNFAESDEQPALPFFVMRASQVVSFTGASWIEVRDRQMMEIWSFKQMAKADSASVMDASQ